MPSLFVNSLVLFLLTGVHRSLGWIHQPWPDSSYLYKQWKPLSTDTWNTNLLNYRLFVPLSYNNASSTKHPIVIFFHGDGEKDLSGSPTLGNPNTHNSKQMTDNGQFAFTDTSMQAILPAFLILPQTYWLGREDLADTMADIVTYTATQYTQVGTNSSKVDLSQVICTGLSGGGGATYSMIDRRSDFYSAAVLLSAPQASYAQGVVPQWSLNRFAFKIPIWLFHAANDGTVGIGNSDNAATSLRQLGVHPIYTRYASGGHTSTTWGAAYSSVAMVTWLSQIKKGDGSLTAAHDPASIVVNSPTSAFNWTTTASSFSLSGSVTQLNAGGAADPLITSVEYGAGDYDIQWNHHAVTGTTSSWTTPSISVAANTTQRAVVAAIGTSWDSGNGGFTYYTHTISVTRLASTTTQGPATSAPATSAPATSAPATTAVHTTAVVTTAPATTAVHTTAAVTSVSPTSAPATTAVHTTAPGTTAPPTTAPATTARATTAVQTTAAATTAPATTASATTAPATTAVHTTALGTTALATTAVHTTAPATTAVHTTAVHTTAPVTTAPATTAVHTTATTAAATTAVHTTAVHTTAPATTAIHTTALHTTAAGTTAVQTTAPGTTAGHTTAPATNAPLTTAVQSEGTTAVQTNSIVSGSGANNPLVASSGKGKSYGGLGLAGLVVLIVIPILVIIAVAVLIYKIQKKKEFDKSYAATI